MEVWGISRRNAVKVFDLRDALTNAIIGDATITAQLLDSAGAAVPGSSFSVAVISVPLGNYGGVSTELAVGVLPHGTEFQLEIIGTRSGSTIINDRIPVVAGYGKGA